MQFIQIDEGCTPHPFSAETILCAHCPEEASLYCVYHMNGTCALHEKTKHVLDDCSFLPLK